jgi:hypothetical protein
LAITEKVRDKTMKTRIKKDIIICILLFVVLLLIVDSNMRPTRLGKTNYYLMDDPGPLELYCIDKGSNSFYECVVSGRITDIYWNEQYILTTQCDVWSDSIAGYYIVKMLPSVEKGVPWEKTKLLSKEEYEQKKQELLLNEKEMKHINLFDNKHIVWAYFKLIVAVCILLTIVWFVLKHTVRFLKSKIQE